MPGLKIDLEGSKNTTNDNKTPNTIDNEGLLSSYHPQADRPLYTDSARSVTQSFKIKTIRSIKFYKPPQNGQAQKVYGS